MKKIYLLITILTVSLTANSQDFNAHLATAKSSYTAGKLEDSRFAMQQAMQELDLKIGAEVLKILPVTMDTMKHIGKADNVTANTGLLGVLIHREYGQTGQSSIDLMSNSPMVTSINAILTMPFIGNSSDGTQKVVKVDGYKGLLQKNTDSENNKTSYTLQIPFGSTLLTFANQNVDEAGMMKLANTIPVAQIAKMLE